MSGTPLPPEWIPDDELCNEVKLEFGMPDDDLQREVPAFHALNVSQGVLSRDWNATFRLFCKRWREYRDRQAPPRVEVSRAGPTWQPSEADWDGTVRLYAETGRWSARLGPDPMSMGCRCPVEVLRKHSIDPETGLKVPSDKESPPEGQPITRSAFRGQS